MKIAVINFSGNVGKTTIARHLLAPRLPGAAVVSIESLNADDTTTDTLRANQFGALQEYLQTVDSAVVDIGASNVEELLALMRRYSGSHDDFDRFLLPTVPAWKQQQDTIATLVDLSRLGVPPEKLSLVFNLVDEGDALPQVFKPVWTFVRSSGVARLAEDAWLGFNEVYERAKGQDLRALASDATDYKALIASTQDATQRLAAAQRLATRRLAVGVVPELDRCFAALELVKPMSPVVQDSVG
ncbi:StbB family protein [Aquincola sp. J276]|uniref:StbB family protein n=1 Tax=Aquincola sp. J276 TaxID=2898432 RepID=UPI002150B98D|nr:StbB family protein [Aquincola sp. J276]MCR5867635.1 hypothetical protein [Aquincola sp. J276]